MATTKTQIDHLFTARPLTDEDAARHERIREAGHAFAHVLLEQTPSGRDQYVAIQRIREAVMFGHAALALQEPRGRSEDKDEGESAGRQAPSWTGDDDATRG